MITLSKVYYRDEIRSANLALISGRQLYCINACIFLVAITKTVAILYVPSLPDVRQKGCLSSWLPFHFKIIIVFITVPASQ